MMSPCADSFNSSMPSGQAMGGLDWNTCGDLLFPNISAELDQTESQLDDVDELLPHLISEEELDIDLAEMGLSDGMFCLTCSHAFT